MSNYAEDYRMSTDEEKLGILKTLWNKKDYFTEKEKLIILEETQKIYDRLKGRSSKMKYFSSWQEAFMWFVNKYSHNFEDSYNLSAEFELQLKQNSRGTYFLYVGADDE